jgi:hypothetical protein
MASHSREKKEKPQRRKKKNKDGLLLTTAQDTTADDGVLRDMELPDDWTVAASSVASSNNFGLDDDDLLLEDVDENNVEEVNRSVAAATARATKLAEALSIATTITSEKRATKREGGYRVLFKAITQYATGSEGREILESRWDSLLEACLYTLQGKGNSTPAEQYAACRVLEASSVVLGGDRDDIAEKLNGPLKKTINATGRVAQVRSAALRCLAMTHFICGTNCLEEGEDAAAVLTLCENVSAESYRGETVNPILRAAALDCWSLLSTTFSDAFVAAGDSDDDYNLGQGLQLLPLLAECLDSTDQSLRRSAGECVSLIHECRLNLGMDEEEAANRTELAYRRGSWDGSEWEVLMDEVKQRIAELSVESGHHMSKKDKKEQRATFRDFMSTIVDDESPEEIVNWRGGKVKLNSWQEIIQCNFVRHCLQGGFQIQLMTNETLQAIFGAVFDGSGMPLNQLEKRMYMSKTSEAAKAADKARTKQRRTRTNVKNHFLTTDGEDI